MHLNLKPLKKSDRAKSQKKVNFQELAKIDKETVQYSVV